MREELLMAKVESDGSRIKLVEVGKYKDAAKLNAALDLVAELASKDVYGVTALRAIAGPGFVHDKKSYPRVELSDPAPVIVEVRDIGGRLATVAMLKEASHWQPVVAEIQEGALVDRSSFRQFSALAHAQVAGVGNADLIVEATLPPRLQWRGVEHESQRLIAGARMLGALSGIGQQRL
jgi:PII-like signaling protein